MDTTVDGIQPTTKGMELAGRIPSIGIDANEDRGIELVDEDDEEDGDEKDQRSLKTRY